MAGLPAELCSCLPQAQEVHLDRLAPSHCPFLDLPDSVLSVVISHLASPTDVASCLCSCRSLRAAAASASPTLDLRLFRRIRDAGTFLETSSEHCCPSHLEEAGADRNPASGGDSLSLPTDCIAGKERSCNHAQGSSSSSSSLIFTLESPPTAEINISCGANLSPRTSSSSRNFGADQSKQSSGTQVDNAANLSPFAADGSNGREEKKLTQEPCQINHTNISPKESKSLSSRSWVGSGSEVTHA